MVRECTLTAEWHLRVVTVLGSWCWKFSDGFPETEQDLEFARREEGQGQGDRGAEKWDEGQEGG